MLALTCTAVLMFIAGFHFHWGFGGTAGLAVAVPQSESGAALFKPSAAAAHLIGLALVAAALCVLAWSGRFALPLPPVALRAIVAFLALVFTARALAWFRYAGWFKKVRNTAFGRYDTFFYCPLCLFLGLGLFYLVAKPGLTR